MNWFEKFLYILDSGMTTPINYGWFHLLFLGLVIAGTILLCIFGKNCSNKTFNKIMFIAWIIYVVLEVYKQVIFTFEYNNGVVEWDYAWYAFPFQFCSTPIYILPFIFLSKEGKFKDAFISFMSTFVLFAGIAVMLYPNDVFISTIGINIQTMVHHGGQVVLGIFCVVYNRKKYNVYYCLQALLVFACLLAVALLLNIIVYNYFQANNIDETFNMFYISPYFDCTLPILNIIYTKVAYIDFLLIYMVGFSIIAFIFHYVSKLIIYLSGRKAVNAN